MGAVTNSDDGVEKLHLGNCFSTLLSHQEKNPHD